MYIYKYIYICINVGTRIGYNIVDYALVRIARRGVSVSDYLTLRYAHMSNTYINISDLSPCVSGVTKKKKLNARKNNNSNTFDTEVCFDTTRYDACMYR